MNSRQALKPAGIVLTSEPARPPVMNAGGVNFMEYIPDKPVWKSYVWHEDKCFFVSTNERTYDTIQGSMRGQETIVWEYDCDKGKRGKMLHQAENIKDHQQICRCLIAKGLIPDENNECDT